MPPSFLIAAIDRDWQVLKLKLESLSDEPSTEIDNVNELLLLLKDLENCISVISRGLPPLAKKREMVSSPNEEESSYYTSRR
jgi:hypothetical protein